MTPTCINPLLYCMHYVSCVKCILKILACHSSLSFKAGSCHRAGSVVTSDTVVWHNNFRCCHWQQDWHRGSSGFSLVVHLFKRLFMFKANSCRVSSYSVLNISRSIYSPKNSEEMPHDLPVRAGYVTFFPLCFVWYRVIVDHDIARVKWIFRILVIWCWQLALSSLAAPWSVVLSGAAGLALWRLSVFSVWAPIQVLNHV